MAWGARRSTGSFALSPCPAALGDAPQPRPPPPPSPGGRLLSSPALSPLLGGGRGRKSRGGKGTEDPPTPPHRCPPPAGGRGKAEPQPRRRALGDLSSPLLPFPSYPSPSPARPPLSPPRPAAPRRLTLPEAPGGLRIAPFYPLPFPSLPVGLIPFPLRLPLHHRVQTQAAAVPRAWCTPLCYMGTARAGSSGMWDGV